MTCKVNWRRSLWLKCRVWRITEGWEPKMRFSFLKAYFGNWLKNELQAWKQKRRKQVLIQVSDCSGLVLSEGSGKRENWIGVGCNLVLGPTTYTNRFDVEAGERELKSLRFSGSSTWIGYWCHLLKQQSPGITEPWSGCSVGWSIITYTKRLQVQFLVST